jgi:hypothetical protein
MNALAIVTVLHSDVWLPLVLYVGPDVLLPLMSALAAIAGAVMMFWRRLVGAAASVWRLVSRRD